VKIKFVVPNDTELDSKVEHSGGGRIFPPVGLTAMLSIASSTHSVSYCDERREKVDHASPADIVIIFINAYNRHHAYDLAKYYRGKGSFVVFTGAILQHAPEDAFSKGNCIFIGEGEEILQNFLNDFAHGKKRRIYGSLLKPILAKSTPALRLVS